MKKIILKGLKQHNLKDISLEIYLDLITCVTGPSGAGKSSLVFDTIYSEAQRRFTETFSPYVRQFLERLPRPKADEIKNLQATIGITQQNPVKNSRSTIATLTEITYSTRMLFFRNAAAYCPNCDIALKKTSFEDVVRLFEKKNKEGLKKAWLVIEISQDEIGHFKTQGFERLIIKGKQVELSYAEPFLREVLEKKEDIFLVIERFSLKNFKKERIKEALDLANELSDKKMLIFFEDGSNSQIFKKYACPVCNFEPRPSTPHLFSFNSPEGACKNCSGFGRVIDIDWDLVIPNKSISLSEGAIRPLENWDEEKEELFEFCIENNIDLKKPWKELSSSEKEAILYGKGNWYGIKEIFDWLNTKRYKAHVRILLSRYRAYNTCPVCKGQRFNKEALSYKLFGLTIAQFYEKNISEALKWTKGLIKKANFDKASISLISDLIHRLEVAHNAGLGYLTLNRSSRTLSGGELSRLCLSKGVSTRLTETLYCIEEPSNGLHPQDMAGVSRVILDLKKGHNTVIMIENDPFMKQIADETIALGPGAGKNGGYIVQEDSSRNSLNLKKINQLLTSKSDQNFTNFLSIKGARQHNLKNITCHFPIGAITCVCGVSGSGKSTLVKDCLYQGLLRLKGLPASRPGKFTEIIGHKYFKKIHFISQEPISKTPRACAGTFLKLLNPIRNLLSETEYAKENGLTPGFFSMNIDGGRCKQCKGQGYEMVEMQFLPDLMLKCEACKGKRFSQEALKVRYRGKNISDFLEMTLFELKEFFRETRLLNTAINLGLGHLLVGQPLNTISSGEAQRLKIAKEINETDKYGTKLFIIDEPTKGLHPDEIKRLLEELRRLKSKGHTVILVEHDLEAIISSDWIIELGPEGGEKGGRLLFEGTPTRFIHSDSPTARFLRKIKKNKEVFTHFHTNKKQITPQAHDDFIKISGARHHNLKDIDIEVPKKKLVVITGVSGSGKSSLAFDLIYQEAQRRYLESLPSYMKQFVKLFERFEVDQIKGLSPSVAVEQKNSKGSSTSTVATLSEIAHYIRLLYTHCSHLHASDYNENTAYSKPEPALFSFNTRSGRCEKCLGLGKDERGNICSKCLGKRFSKSVSMWKIDNISIDEFYQLEIFDAYKLLENWNKDDSAIKKKREVANLLLKEAMARLKVLEELGLGYLSLDRSGESLSGGEAQRIRLSTLAFSNLTGLTIVLDEPTIGLHPKDNKRLIKVLKALRDKGNSIIVVEHDEETISQADYIIDLGPGGGKNGGKIVFKGTFKELLQDKRSLTASYFKNAPKPLKEKTRIGPKTKWLEIKGAQKHNLKSIDIKIPLDCITFIVGVSGSGKTTLLNEIILKALSDGNAPITDIKGHETIKNVLKIDHNPIGRTPRSCPATFVGLFSQIRALFSRLPASRVKGLTPSHFSFNTKEGMCPVCKGQGVIRQKLGILPDVLITCEKCMGRRFNDHCLEAKWKGLNISQVLNLTIDEAYELFFTIPSLKRGLGILKDLGLGYLTLGQQSPTLSGGEAQRLKIAKELLKSKSSGKLYLFDEPTIGLHMADIAKLAKCIHKLADSGNTIVIVEHNPSLIREADWIIELGPGGGRYGGKVIFQGEAFRSSI